MNIEKMIQETVQITIENMVKELKQPNTPGTAKKTAFQQVETILYNYPKFQDSIKSKLQEIDTIKKEGVSKRSGSIVQYSKNSSVYDVSDELLKAGDAIEKLENNIKEIESYLSMIDSALQSIKDAPYFNIIRMKYFEDKTHEDIAECLKCDVLTVSKNKNRLLNILQIHLFPDKFLLEMGLIA